MKSSSGTQVIEDLILLLFIILDMDGSGQGMQIADRKDGEWKVSHRAHRERGGGWGVRSRY